MADIYDDADPFLLPPPASPRRPGRPRAPARAVRAYHMGLRLLASERIRLSAAARRAGYDDTSAWARGVLLSACDGVTSVSLDAGVLVELAQLRRDLNGGAGANLNQALLHANTLAKAGGQPDGAALLTAVQAAHSALDALRAELQRQLSPRGRT